MRNYVICDENYQRIIDGHYEYEDVMIYMNLWGATFNHKKYMSFQWHEVLFND